jgi:hypothetical protein
MGFPRSNLTSRPIRFWVMRGYPIAYAPEHDPLFILATIHGRHHPRTIARILAARQQHCCYSSGLVNVARHAARAFSYRRCLSLSAPLAIPASPARALL